MELAGCQVMAKPTGSVCNIDCTYCFYLEKEALYPERNKNWRMSDETLECYIRQHIEAQMGETVTFAWQGGEPTMMGLPFFRQGDLKHLHNNALDIAPDPDIEYLIQEIAKLP